MSSLTNRVKTFDAFPKVNSEHQVRSTRGGLLTIITVFCGLFIFWVEVGGFLGGYVRNLYSVDPEIKSEITINVDLLVAMPCEYLHTNVYDVANDRFLAGDFLNYEGTSFFLPHGWDINNQNDKHTTPDLDEVMQELLRAEFLLAGLRINDGAPACHIFGSFPVNQVKGNFHITAKGVGYQDRLNVQLEALNFTHVINEFSFGEFYPYINNPLDYTGKVTHKNLQSYKYFAQVVPTKYERLSLEIDTNQYSLTELARVEKQLPNHHITGLPGIVLHYDFEPIKLTISEKRIPFFVLVARLATILGGLFVLAGHFYRLYERLLALLFSKKYANRDTEKKHGGLLNTIETKE